MVTIVVHDRLLGLLPGRLAVSNHPTGDGVGGVPGSRLTSSQHFANLLLVRIFGQVGGNLLISFLVNVSSLPDVVAPAQRRSPKRRITGTLV